jgi:hypothetical protein
MTVGDAAITAALGFLVAVLWFDLMFDVQVVAHRDEPEVPDETIQSIATYYKRVTTDASPMGRLVAVVMLALLILLVAQAVGDGTPGWVSVISLASAGVAIVLAIARVVPHAVRLGARTDAPEVQSALARGIFRDHVAFLALIVTVLVVQLAAA